MTNNQMFKPDPDLLESKLDDAKTRRQDWEALANVLNNENAAVPLLLVKLAKAFSTSFILHEAIRRGAPDDVLMSLLDHFPVLIFHLDGSGQFPLHVACVHGASPKFVARCIDRHPSSITAKDTDGKTPLHLLCQGTWSSLWNFQTHLLAKKHMAEIHSMLTRRAPLPSIPENDVVVEPPYQVLSYPYSGKRT